MRVHYLIIAGCLCWPALPLQAEAVTPPQTSVLAQPVACKLAPGQEAISLPPPAFQGQSLEQVLQLRRSERRFSQQPLSLQQLSQLLWAAQGITRADSGQRTAPSSGRSYPVDLYVSMQSVVGVACGLYRYQSKTHSLRLVAAADYGAALTQAAEGQRWVGEAAVVILHVATPARAAEKYGASTAMSSSLLEAGHISQNIYLQATSLGLAVLGMNGFSPAQLDQLLGLAAGQTTLFINLVGVRPGS